MAKVALLSVVAAIVLCASNVCAAHRSASHYRPTAPYSALGCRERAVLDRIVADFDARYWPLALIDVRVREAKWNSWPQAMIPRRFCEGQVIASDGQPPRPIYYSIIEDGPAYRVESCVVGLDHDWSYNPHCRLARP